MCNFVGKIKKQNKNKNKNKNKNNKKKNPSILQTFNPR